MRSFLFITAVAGMVSGVCIAQSDASSASCSSAAKPIVLQKDWNVRDHIPLKRFVVQSHRGAGELVPENTLEAFETGWNLGTVPEADVRATADGVIVAFHDGNFKRLVKGASPALQKKGVENLNVAELSKLDVGLWKGEQFAGRRIPKIAEIFALMRGKPERWLYLDIKIVDLPQLSGLVHEYGVERQVVFTSPKPELIRDWKKMVPESQTLHWMGGTEEELKTRLGKLRETGFEGITQIQLHVRLNTNAAPAEPFNLSHEFIRTTGTELRQHGILLQSLPWGVTEAKVYWQLLDLGVMSFATDFPKITLAAVADYYAQKKP